MKSFEALSKEMVLLASNPAAMQTVLLRQLSDISNGDDRKALANPTDPVVFLAEAGVMLAHSVIEGCRATVPKMFPSQAQTMDDLYRHMSDVDYIDVFSVPSQTTLQLILDVDSLLSKAMPLVYAGVRRLIIPADTEFKIGGYYFSIQYPIEIRVLPYGTPETPAFEVLWVTDQESPIKSVTTNALDWVVGKVPSSSSQLLRVDIPVIQYQIKSYSETTTATNVFKMVKEFQNRFYYARVWNRDNSGKWKELTSTHSRDVYDPAVPTALLQVAGNKIQCIIPSVYMQSGQVSGEIRLDVYTTMGPMDIDLSSYPSDQFTWNLRDLNGQIDSSYVNPLKTFSIVQLMAPTGTRTVGGRKELSFADLRQRVIDNAVGIRKSPITDKQVSSKVNEYGLTLLKAIDYVTSRTYLLSSPMPESTVPTVSSPIGAVTAPVVFSWEELAKLSTVRVNGSRLTVLPATLYRFNGTELVVDQAMTESFRTMRREDLITAGNSNSYLFSPFHYVVDINNTSIDVRTYQLDKPQITNKRFVTTNITTELSVVTGDTKFLTNERGFVLQVLTKSGRGYQGLRDDQLFVQLSFKPRNSDNYAYINGTLVGKIEGERVWEFVLETNLDVDRNDELILNNTRLNSPNQTDVPVGLSVEYNLFYGCNGYMPGNYSRVEMDTIIVPPTVDSIGITHEMLRLELGKSMESYWSKARAINDTINYKRYTENEYYTWEEDIPERDEKDVPIYTIDPTATPPVQMVWKHRRGDVVIDPATGKPTIKNEIGSIVYDGNGEPVIDQPRRVKFRNEMPVYDARYRFANTTQVKSYLNAIIDRIVALTTTTIPTLTKSLLERTDAFFVPITTMGYISVRTEDGAIAPIQAEQRFSISYYMSAANRQNTDMIRAIQSKTSVILNNYLKSSLTISSTELGRRLKEELGDTVIGIEVEGMGPDQDMRLFTIIDEASQVTLGKKLQLEPNGDIGLIDDISTAFKRHDTSQK